MTKLLLMILAAAAIGLVLRRALTRAGIIKPRKAAADGAMARLKRELDLLLWIPPILLALGGVYVVASLIYGALTR
ncbi:MAG: hypothetical protein ACO27F_04415 [Beijerinckiaceae bacterium]|jgi:hypothetical protein